MPADAALTPGWRTRVRLLAADLVAFDPRRLGWVLAARTLAGLLLPLLLAHAVGRPELVWIGLGAFLLAIGDCVDDGDRLQARRLAVGTALGAVALATGVLAGGSLPVALAGMLVWGVLTGMMGVYGSAFATMSLPVAWAYVELGVPAADHSLPHALLLGGLFALGGGLTFLLTFALRLGGPHAPVRAQAAACFRQVAHYCDGGGPRGTLSPETQVRSAIAEARRMAAQARGAAQASSRTLQRTLVLIEIADRLFSLAGALREAGLPPPAPFRLAALGIARALDGHADTAELHRLMAALDAHGDDRPGDEEPAPAGFDARILEVRMGRELSHALHVVLGDAMPEWPRPAPAAAARLSTLVRPLVEALDPDSVVARHALRFAVVAAVAVAVFWVFPKPFGYWVPLTVTVVLKPYAGMTLARAVQRLVGTAAGILVGLALMPLLATPALQLGCVAILFFFMMAVLPFNYSLAIFLLSAGLIPFEHVLTPGLQQDVGVLRLIATAIGALLALVGGHLLWPTFERRGLPGLLRTATRAAAAYAACVLAAAEGRGEAGEMGAARRRIGLALTNLQATVQRALSEIGGDPGALQATLRASTALQRLFSTLNALMQAAPALAPGHPPLAGFRATLVPALAGLGADAQPLSTAAVRAALPALGETEDAVFLRRMLERLASEYEMLGAALQAPAA